MPTLPLGPFPLGIDNVHNPAHRVFQLGEGSIPRLVGAVDVDLTDTGWFRSRPSLGELHPTISAACLGVWSASGRLFWQEGDLLYEDGSPLLGGLTRRVEICEHGDKLYVSDGSTNVELDSTGVWNWGLPVPTLSLAPGLLSTLTAKSYLVRAAFVDSRGNEGGVSNIASITLAVQGSIEVSISGATPDCVAVNIYAGYPNQPTTSFVAQVDIASFPYTISAVNVSAADPPKTAQMVGPPVRIEGIFSFRAFLMLWRDNFILRSEGFEPHLYHPDNIMQFSSAIQACAGLPGGMWVGTETGLWWVTGESPDSWIPLQKSSANICKGSFVVSGTKIPELQTSDLVALFVSKDGLLAGMNNGQLVNLTFNRYKFNAISRASFAYVEQDDLRQILIALEV